MSTLNQYMSIGVAAPPDEVAAFRRMYPHIYEALNVGLTTQIQQLNIRVGGSGSGSSVTDLSTLTAQADATENWLGGIAARSNKKTEAQEVDQYDALLSMIGGIKKEVAKIAEKADEIEANRMMLGQILANQREISRRIDELEAVCLSSLAR